MAASIKFITVVIMIVVTIVILFSILGGTQGELVNAGDSITKANNCTLSKDTGGGAMTYNKTSDVCQNSSGGIDPVTPDKYRLPLNGLFGSTGVVLLILMAVLFLIILGTAFYAIKGKK